MKILLDIKDNKAAFVLELLKNFSFVKTKTLSESKAEMIVDFSEAMDEMKMIKQGKKKVKKAQLIKFWINILIG